MWSSSSILAVMLVVLVIFVFLRNLPATFIPSLSVPLSIVGTFAAMYLLGYSLNNLSLMALTISAGFVVDDAIVMIENITRYLEEGESPLDAAMKGAGEIGFTIVSLTVSLIAVLIPLLFMQEVVGRLFREFAVTLAITILISAVVSLTLVPMLCAKLLRSHARRSAQQSRLRSAAPRNITSGSSPNMTGCCAGCWTHQPLTHDGGGRHPGAHRHPLYPHPQGLLPAAGHRLHPGHHHGRAHRVVRGDGAAASSLLAQKILQDPDVASLSSFIGVDGTNNTLNSGRFLINLKPKSERDGVSEIMRPAGGRCARCRASPSICSRCRT